MNLNPDQSGVTVGTVNALASGVQTSIAAAVWNALASAYTIAGSLGKLIATYLDAHISGIDVPGALQSYGTAKTSDVSAAVTAIDAHVDSSIGGLNIPTVAQIQSGLATPANVTAARDAVIQALPAAPNNAGIDAIKAQTDRLKFASDGTVDSNIAGNIQVTVGDVDLTPASIDAVRSGLAQESTLQGVSTAVRALAGIGDGEKLLTYTVGSNTGLPLAGITVTCFKVDPDDSSHYIPQGKQTSGADGKTQWMATPGVTYHFYCEDPSGAYTFPNPDIEVAS